MMSDEERVGDKYIRHPPSYRSDMLSCFIEKLESRLDSTPSYHACHKRELGSPVEKQAPARAKNWMLKDAEGAAVTNEDLGSPASDLESFGMAEDEETELI
jgi:hypothetical protein